MVVVAVVGCGAVVGDGRLGVIEGRQMAAGRGHLCQQAPDAVRLHGGDRAGEDDAIDGPLGRIPVRFVAVVSEGAVIAAARGALDDVVGLALGDDLSDMALKLTLYTGGQRMAQLLRTKVSDFSMPMGEMAGWYTTTIGGLLAAILLWPVG